MSDFVINGIVKDSSSKPLNELFVQAYDSDQEFLQDRNDDLLGSAWTKNDGMFRIGFDNEQFKEKFNILERGPDIYLTIRKKDGMIIHTTPIRKNVKSSDAKKLKFDVTIPKSEKPKSATDPYSDNMSRRISAFSSFGQRADFTDDMQRSFSLLLGTLNAWLGYSNEISWDRVGYDGPLVDRYPWRRKHKPHKVRWKNE